jgi:sigma-B regulation protein RsbU (phosphoserine phosphatase)
MPPRQMIAGVARRGFDPGPPEDDQMLMHGEGITGYVIRTCQSVVVSDVRKDARYIEGRRSTLSEIAVPIILNERSIGALNLESDHLAIFTDDDLEVLQFFADAAAISIEKAMLHRRLIEQELISKQLETAREVQSRLLPERAPKFPGYDIAGVCIPAYEIGGDYYDYIPLPGDRLGLAVADVTGHGISSALVMTAFRVLLRTKARANVSPAQIARRINRLLPEFAGGDNFVTLLYIILEGIPGTVTYTTCGHPPPLLLRADGEVIQSNQRNLALGIARRPDYRDESLQLVSGDTLVLYTDGVIELANPQGEAFGLSRLVQVVRQNQTLTASDLVMKIIESARAFSSNHGFLDDLTLVIMRSNSPAAAG